MYLDVGEVRFLTKVAEKSPRGLRPLLFKSKKSGTEKLVFIVKTASEEVDKLALSKMTWQLEQSKVAPRVVILRLLILPEGATDFYKSEAGLLMNEQKDRKIVETLSKQNSIEIYFFTFENEFHSKIELMTTFNMAKGAENVYSRIPPIDDSRLIVQSENLSEYDIKQAMTGKINETTVKQTDLADSIQKKMPTVSSSVPKTKPVENSKISIKSNDILSNKATNVTPQPKNNSGLTADELKKSASAKSGSLSAEELLKSIPPGRISPDELLKSIPPNKFSSKDIFETKTNGFNKEDESQGNHLLDLVNSVPPGELTQEELLKSLSSSEKLTSDDLLKSLNELPEDTSGARDQELDLSSLLGEAAKPQGSSNDKLSKEDLFSAMKEDQDSDFVDLDDNPTSFVDKNATVMLKRGELDSLMNELQSQPTPLKEKTDPLKDTSKLPADMINTGKLNLKPHAETGKLPEIPKIPEEKKELKSEIRQDRAQEVIPPDPNPTGEIDKSPTVMINEKDLLDALMSEPSPLKEEEIEVIKENKQAEELSISEEDLLKALKGES